MICQRMQGDRGEDWWFCKECRQTWNERNVGPHWRPADCPERKHRELAMSRQAFRDKENHH